MDNYKRGTIVKIERDEKLQCDFLCLRRTDKSLFVLREYRTEPNHVVGSTINIPITGQEEDYISPKNGESYSCYTTKAKLKGTTTELKVDEKGDCTPTSFSTLSPTDLLHLSGNALILKALAPTCTIDQCVQSVVQLANDLKKQQ